MNKTKVKIYTPLHFGGPTAWGQSLCKALNRNNVEAELRNSLSSYLLEPFNTGVSHSTLPFFIHPVKGKYVLTIHGIYTEEPLLWSKLYPRAIKIADTVTTSCNFIKERFNLKDAIVIPNGTDKPSWTKKDYELINEIPTLGILSGFSFLNKAKGLIDLAKAIKKMGIKVKLLVGGTSGVFFDEVWSEVMKVGVDCEFLGFCNPHDFLKKIDIFTYYSHQDVSSIALLEAITSGVPVMTNDIGGNAEMFDGELMKLVASSVDQYTAILSELVKSKSTREKYGKLQLEKTTRLYWDNIIPDWKKVYTS